MKKLISVLVAAVFGLSAAAGFAADAAKPEAAEKWGLTSAADAAIFALAKCLIRKKMRPGRRKGAARRSVSQKKHIFAPRPSVRCVND